MYYGYYEPDDDYDYEKPDPKADIIYECAECVKALLPALYNKDKLDIREFESNLEELCHVLKIKLPCGELQVERKKQPTPAILNDWVDFNQGYLQAIAK